MEDLVRAAVRTLMAEDAQERGVLRFEPDVPVWSLPDILLALARSRAHSSSAALAHVAQQSWAW